LADLLHQLRSARHGQDQLTAETVFVLGGARSGKTAYGLSVCETLHAERGMKPVYVASAQAFDSEMTDRIERHKAERGPHWRTVEAPHALAETIRAESTPATCLLVDCLTLWLTNLMLAEVPQDLDAAWTELVAALREAEGPVVVISNEVGLGIVPENALARRFRDEAGRLNQMVAAACDRVVFVAAGIPMTMKPALKD